MVCKKPELSEAFRSLVLGRTVCLTCLYGLCCPLRLMIPISLSPTHIQGMGKPLECARSAKLPLQSFRITSKNELSFAVTCRPAWNTVTLKELPSRNKPWIAERSQNSPHLSRRIVNIFHCSHLNQHFTLSITLRPAGSRATGILLSHHSLYADEMTFRS